MQLSVGDCKYPCNCTLKETCKFGVNMIKDGCDCCLMCARQQGDLCNYRDKCDDDKGLYCDLKLDAGMRGVCRGTSHTHTLTNIRSRIRRPVSDHFYFRFVFRSI